jgi:hypothetical protein
MAHRARFLAAHLIRSIRRVSPGQVFPGNVVQRMVDATGRHTQRLTDIRRNVQPQERSSTLITGAIPLPWSGMELLDNRGRGWAARDAA